MNRVKVLRTKEKLNQQAFAERLGVDKTTVGSWENGDLPRTKAAGICKEFGCDIKWLMCEGSDPITIADRIREIRGCYGWSQAEMAKQIGVSKQGVTNWERTNNVPDKSCRLICDKLKINYDWLKTGEGEMFSATQAVQRAGTPKDLAIIYGFDHRTAEAIERYVQLPADKRLEFSETLSYVMLGRPRGDSEKAPENGEGGVDSGIVMSSENVEIEEARDELESLERKKPH